MRVYVACAVFGGDVPFGSLLDIYRACCVGLNINIDIQLAIDTCVRIDIHPVELQSHNCASARRVCNNRNIKLHRQHK